MSEDLRAYVDTKVAALELRVRGIENSNAKAEVHHLNVEKRLSSIEGSLSWLVRLIIGAILLAVIAFIIGGGISI